MPLHSWDMFIEPRESTATLTRHGLRLHEMVGLGPRAKNPVGVVLDFIRAGRGRISYGELSRRLDFGQTSTRWVSYMGYATRDVRT
jgi:2-polyprenyl-6-hydroxyphenyl methylase/3-demethylubiquinone-9 3-methyltransferase